MAHADPGCGNAGVSGNAAGGYAQRFLRARHHYRQVLDLDPFAGHLFLFRGKSGSYLKALYWDGSGLCLFANRLERGRFVWPPLIEGYQVLTPGQLATLIEGMDWRRTVAPPEVRRPALV